jgi:hypothetical protein
MSTNLSSDNLTINDVLLVVPPTENETEIKIPNQKPYRSGSYDKYDTEYATKLKELFLRLDDEIITNFNEFTENLMDDIQINRYSLLKAIDNFEKSKNYKFNITNSNWYNFSNTAFNFRPYQGCCVM